MANPVSKQCGMATGTSPFPPLSFPAPYRSLGSESSPHDFPVAQSLSGWGETSGGRTTALSHRKILPFLLPGSRPQRCSWTPPVVGQRAEGSYKSHQVFSSPDKFGQSFHVPNSCFVSLQVFFVSMEVSECLEKSHPFKFCHVPDCTQKSPNVPRSVG